MSSHARQRSWPFLITSLHWLPSSWPGTIERCSLAVGMLH